MLVIPAAAGVFELPANSTCQLKAQVKVVDGATLDLAPAGGADTLRAVIEPESSRQGTASFGCAQQGPCACELGTAWW